MKIVGRKGAVITPFCDPKFVKMTLAIPIEIKQDQSLYNCLLEKTKQGLSEIPSTNTKDMKKLEPYLTQELILSVHNRILSKILPKNYRRKINKIIKRLRKHKSSKTIIVEEAIKNPPTTFMHLLTPKIKNAIKTHNSKELTQYAYYLSHILVLDRFFSIEPRYILK